MHNKKQKSRKILCIVLAITSISSMVTPTSYADDLPRAILQLNGIKALVVDTTEQGCENQAALTVLIETGNCLASFWR
ncbi:hypothetical protein FACS1894198_5320 [Clostridia bacterium]|nr:hypothetical protein FACS1894198_5320 [Clostridia bacterium]